MRGYHYSPWRMNASVSRALLWIVAAGGGAVVYLMLQTCLRLSQ